MDERQERARGVAFKYGFFSLMFALFLYGMLDMVLGSWCDAMTGAVLCLCAGVTVFAATRTVKDLTFRCTDLAVGIMVTVVLAVYIVNHLLRDRGEEAE